MDGWTPVGFSSKSEVYWFQPCDQDRYIGQVESCLKILLVAWVLNVLPAPRLILLDFFQWLSIFPKAIIPNRRISDRTIHKRAGLKSKRLLTAESQIHQAELGRSHSRLGLCNFARSSSWLLPASLSYIFEIKSYPYLRHFSHFCWMSLESLMIMDALGPTLAAMKADSTRYMVFPGGKQNCL